MFFGVQAAASLLNRVDNGFGCLCVQVVPHHCKVKIFRFTIQIAAEDLRKHTCIAYALDWRRTVQLDLTVAVVLDTLLARNRVHLDEDERDLASLIFESDVHLLGEELLSNGVFNFLVALRETLALDLLVDKLFYLPNFFFYSVA